MNEFDNQNNNPDMGGNPLNEGQYQQPDYQQNNQNQQYNQQQQNQQYNQQQQNQQYQQYQQPYYQPVPMGYQQKSKMAAGLLGIFLGTLGIHNFYLGFTNKALIQLLVSIIGGVITCGIAAVAVQVWGLIEGIMILANENPVDAKGFPLSS